MVRPCNIPTSAAFEYDQNLLEYYLLRALYQHAPSVYKKPLGFREADVGSSEEVKRAEQ
jgi:hypothetical protein